MKLTGRRAQITTWGRVVCDLASYEAEYVRGSLNVTATIEEGTFSEILADSEGPFTLALHIGKKLKLFPEVGFTRMGKTIIVTWKGVWRDA